MGMSWNFVGLVSSLVLVVLQFWVSGRNIQEKNTGKILGVEFTEVK